MNAIRFGTDGWRAVIGDSFTFENVRKVSQALAWTFKNEKKNLKVFVGYDHRFMAERFAEESAKILSWCGYKPLLLNVPVTSPVLSFLTWKKKGLFGVMITASHNPPQYLGFKVKGSFGGSIAEETAQEIERNLKSICHAPSRYFHPHPHPLPSRERIQKREMIRGREKNDTLDIFSEYNSYLKSHLEVSLFKKNKSSVVFDSLYGPSGRFVKNYFESFAAKIRLELIHMERDPLFGGLHPEPIEENLGELKRTINIKKSLVGFALDGDGDRLGVVDEKGNYLTPQQVFALLLYYLASKKKLSGKVVQTVSLGYLSKRISQDFGLPCEEVPVGFKYVAEKMLSEEVLIGGEESGGYAFGKTSTPTSSPPCKGGDKRGGLIPERDGLFSALFFLEMIFASQKSVSQQLQLLEKKYGKSCYLRQDLKLSHPIEDKNSFVKKIQEIFPSPWLGQKIKEMRTADGLKIIFSDDSWLLLRPSGTEPLLRVYAEFPHKNLTKKSIDKLSKLLYNVLKS